MKGDEMERMKAHDLGPSSIYGIWRIDSTDNSFSTQSFRIKYARQDSHLCMMISFNLSLSRFEVINFQVKVAFWNFDKSIAGLATWVRLSYGELEKIKHQRGP
ncbi:uncharacterized protein LOC109804320 [Cajanus cajan]|uniref:uncharacterized protein LOC109804320 n=1 Tax=Cajanus cajan TaxID=3821 RepID=UPI00098D960F|nr:uncharacterized protein LOC109804320 [Cajanus cajan]